jgi:hypothetical protein
MEFGIREATKIGVEGKLRNYDCKGMMIEGRKGS